jgi:hypothetical protein
LEALYAKILTICTEQFPVIDSVFPAVACDSIRELLVERLFNDPAFGILSFLDQFLKTRRYTEQPASDAEGLASDSTVSSPSRDYVKLLCAAYERTCAMVAEIEAIERASPSELHKRDAASSHDPVIDDDRPVKPGDSERIHTFLSLQLHSLFGNHREKYLGTELDLLHDQFKAILDAVQFPKPPVPSKNKASKAKTTAAAPAANSATPSPSASSTQLVSSASTTSISSSSFEKDGGLLQLESSLVFFESLRSLAEDESLPSKYAEVMAEVVERGEVILKGSELRGELVTKMFTSFVASFGDEYLGVRRALAVL